MAHSFFDVGLQGVVSRYTGCGVRLRLGRIPDIRHAKVHIAAFVIRLVWFAVRQINRASLRARKAIRLLNCVAVGVVLLEWSAWTNRFARRRDLRLIEWKG